MCSAALEGGPGGAAAERGPGRGRLARNEKGEEAGADHEAPSYTWEILVLGLGPGGSRWEAPGSRWHD